MRLPALRPCWRILSRRAALTVSTPPLHRRSVYSTPRLLAMEKHEFQAETKNLMDIVAKSLYSQSEVFVRELISNASDALEKRRVAELSGQVAEGPTEIRIKTDAEAGTVTFEDTGIGMDRDDLKRCLGTIAHSGSKEFIEQNKNNSEAVIGKFGVGFYSAFMVSDSVTVTTRKVGSSDGLRWTWRGDNSYSIEETADVPTGTQIQIHLRSDAVEFAKQERIADIISKYSYFVASPIFLNGERVNSTNAIWTMNPKEVATEMYDTFYTQLVKDRGQLFPRPLYTLHFRTDTPVSVRAVIFIPQHHMSPQELAMHFSTGDFGLGLYARRVLIKPHAKELLPPYFHFLVGVVDSEDIPLNLSREMLQNDPLLRKLQRILTDKLLAFLHSEMKKNPARYADFYRQYSQFLRIGSFSEPDRAVKEQVAKLLLFESSNLRAGELTNLGDYEKRLQEGQKEIYYMYAQSRQLAESSPYFEVVKSQNKEVLFIYDPADEAVFLDLVQFGGKQLVPVEKWAGQEATKVGDEKEHKEFRDTDKKELLDWIKVALGSVKVHEITGNHRPSDHPFMITAKDERLGAARHLLRIGAVKDQEHLVYSQPTLHVNLTHPLVKSLYKLKKNNPETAKLLVEQVYDNALITAGLHRDTTEMVARLNKLLTELAADKHKSVILTP